MIKSKPQSSPVSGKVLAEPPTISDCSDKSPLSFVLPVLALYITFLVISVMTHEMWRDELEAWGMARDSHSFAELQQNSSSALHPMLWYLTLYGLSHFTRQPEAMQVAHAFFAIVAVYVFLRYSSFKKIHKVLFVLGYFMIYEYSVISRNYCQGVLLAFCVCALWPQRARRLVAISLLLLLLANINLFGLMLSLAFAFTLAVEYVSTPEFRRDAGKLSQLIGLALVMLGALFYVLTVVVYRHGITWMASPWTQGFDADRLSKTFQLAGRAFVPIPYLFVWQTNFLSTLPTFHLLLSLGVIAFSLFALIRRKLAMLLYGAMMFEMFFFGYMRHFCEIRHQGHLYLTFICAMWISAYYVPREPKSNFVKLALSSEHRIREVFLYGVLLVQVCLGFHACVMDWEYPFSQSGAVAEYLKKNNLADKFIMAEPDWGGEPIAILLDRQFYYFRGERMGSYVIWDTKRSGGVQWGENPLNMEKVLPVLNSQKDAILITIQPVQGNNIYPLARFAGALTDEQYFVYSVRNP